MASEWAGRLASALTTHRISLFALAVVVAYLLVGYTAVPPLLVPLGCEGFGDDAVGYSPSTGFDVAYSGANASLTVTHAGGDVLPAKRVESLDITVTREDERVARYTWAGSGGSYPVHPGDSLTVQNATVNGNPLADGDTIRVVWTGTWPDDTPDYCPNSHPVSGSATLARSEL